MALFGRKNKKEGNAPCCCGGNFNAESMAQAEQAKTEGADIKILGSGCAKCNQLEAAVKLMQGHNIRVDFPMDQSCCGLPVVMMGQRETARDVALQNMDAFEKGDYDVILTLCASCASQLKEGYVELFAGQPGRQARAKALADKVMDFSTFAKEKLKEMGPMSKNEKKAGLYFLLTLIAFCTNKWHHIAPDYIVFVTIFLMLCPGIGVCTFKDLNGTFAWPAFLQLGFAMSLATCVNKTGGFQWLVDAIFTTNPAFAAMNINTFLIIWLSFVVVLHIIFAGMNAMEAVMVPVSMTMASALGFDPYTMGLLTVMAISAGAFFLPFNSAPNLIFYSTGRFSKAQELKGAIPIALLIIIGLIFSVKVWFPVIGIL